MAGQSEESPHLITKLAAAYPDPDAPAGNGNGSSASPSTASESPSRPPATREPKPVSSVSLAQIDQLIAAGNFVEARVRLAPLAPPGTADPPDEAVVSRLLKLADETIFGPRIYPNDPLVATHVLTSGEVLARVADRYRISPGLIASINNIPDMNRVRMGQRLKVLNGPLHAVVYKSRFEVLVYLGDTLIERFPVGLGTEGSTPTGVWQVSEKLTNPTYYPPRAGGSVIPADDPENPLGEYWIGLKGIEGEALGQRGYGIHGTIEPDSIGKNASMGCIRLHNEDVARLYAMLARNDSKVTILN